MGKVRGVKIVFVCTGNICRSPMGEKILVSLLEERGITGVEVASAGTWAQAGREATPEAVAVMRAQGLDAAAHRASELSATAVAEADLLVAMTSVHLREIGELGPQARGKTVLLKELAEIAPLPLPADASSEDRVAALLQGERPPWRRSLDLDDPFGLPGWVYERCFGDLHKGIVRLVELLWPERTRRDSGR